VLNENERKGSGFIRLGNQTFSLFAVHAAENSKLNVVISADIGVFVAARAAIIDYICRQVSVLGAGYVRKVLEGIIPCDVKQSREDHNIGFITITHRGNETELAFRGITSQQYVDWFGPIASK